MSLLPMMAPVRIMDMPVLQMLTLLMVLPKNVGSEHWVSSSTMPNTTATMQGCRMVLRITAFR